MLKLSRLQSENHVSDDNMKLFALLDINDKDIVYTLFGVAAKQHLSISNHNDRR